MKDDRATDLFLFVIAAALVGAGVLYVIFLFWPYLVYYFLPFVGMSLALGGLFRFITINESGEGVVTGSYLEDRKYKPHFNYRALLFAYPVLILLTLFVFETNSVQKVMVDKKGKEVGQFLEWPELHKSFNDARTDTYKSSPFDSLKAEAGNSVLYDRRQLSWIVWWALFFGAPSFFMWLSRKDDDVESCGLYKIISEKTKALDDHLHRQIEEHDKIVAKKVFAFQKEAENVRAEMANVLLENKRLQATVEFSKEVVRPGKSSDGKEGLLDRDIL